MTYEAKCMVVMAAAALMLAWGCSTPREQPVTSVPAAAQKTIDQFAEGGTIREVEMSEKCGRVLYEAEVKKADGSKIEILVDKQGKLYKMVRKEHNNE